MVGLCFLSVFIFNLPVIFKSYDLSNSSSIGDSIGGITAPVIGIISSILLYLALTKQTESNIDQKLKNESDLILSLFNQLDLELNSLYFKFKNNSVDVKFNGLEALDEFAKRFGIAWNMDHFKEKFSSFKAFYPSGQIIYLIDTINLIDERISSSTLSPEMKNLFKQKLISFYDSKLRDSFDKINNRICANQFLEDDWASKIKVVVAKY
ncbi:hypothetical protein SAMN04488131_10214 [Flavobacterium xueshanense]|uniref:Phage abortive infection protein n=2 Tax=Flavobacterium xueshanense TaxID=935223 RepID=A0A1I2AH41_9FLAO|nr:hypothetical protein SAMN04488131_10214 [Flavobacterium xueshanense]